MTWDAARQQGFGHIRQQVAARCPDHGDEAMIDESPQLLLFSHSLIRLNRKTVPPRPVPAAPNLRSDATVSRDSA